MISAALIFTYAIQTTTPLYIREPGPPFREWGARLEIHKPLPHGFYADLIPYVWAAGEGRVESGGAMARLGWEGSTVGVSFFHRSEHNFDRFSKGGTIEFDAVEIKWKLN